jgi:hypothetical protein
MASRTTLWRQKKLAKSLDLRGRKTNDARADCFLFVGAVAAQLLTQGFATYAGLKTYGERVGTVREREIKSRLTMAMSAGDAAETSAMIAALNEESMNAQCGDVRPVWVKPADAVMMEILATPFNPDCLALAAAYFGKLNYETRHGKLRGIGYSENTRKRESSRVACWKSIDSMNRKTANYWMKERKSDYEKAYLWLGKLLVKHGLSCRPIVIDNPATLLRDDLADAMGGKVLKVPRADN